MCFWLRQNLALPLMLLILAAPSRAQSSHARVELIAEQNTVVPGRPLWVGLLFQLDQGWHIYWQNPGDSGEPPKVQWQLPPGFAAGPILWPQPIRLGSGAIIDYGYEGQVLLMVPLNRTATEHGSSLPNIAADVKYIVCREMCIPGKTHLTLATPADGNWEQWRALFERTRQQLPKPMPPGWKVSAESNKTSFVLTVRDASPVRSSSFFPLEPSQIDNSSPQLFASNRAGFQLTLKKSDQLVKPISTLRGLLMVGAGRSIEVDAPVVSR
jgi:thiol:disulfide interchange protein DsbD